MTITLALRQYRHNNTNDFIMAYDKEETDKVVEHLQDQINKLTMELNANHSHRKLQQFKDY